MNDELKKLCGAERPNPIKIVQAFDHDTSKAWREYELDELAKTAEIGTKESVQFDLLCACQMAATNPDCFDDWHAFHHVAVVFNHRRANFEFLDAISYMEAAWACHVLRSLNPRHEFGLGIQRYILALCLHDGVLYFPWTGGNGLNICRFYPSTGLMDASLCKTADEIQEKWKSGVLADLSPSEVNDSDILHVQLAKIINAQEYIRACSII